MSHWHIAVLVRQFIRLSDLYALKCLWMLNAMQNSRRMKDEVYTKLNKAVYNL